MRKLRYAYWAVSLFCLCTSVWAGSSIHVWGDVWGTWPTGDSVYVDSACVVPANKGLVIEAGAVVAFKTTDPFVIRGSLHALGSETDSIVILPCENWDGFYFAPNGRDLQILEYVVIPEFTSLPWRVISSDSANLRIAHCSLRGTRSCFDLSHGRLWASHNYLVIHGQYSHAVVIRNLENDQTRCSPQGNSLTGNIIKAEVPPPPSPWIPSPSEFTSGLYVDGSTNLCMWDNAISVIAAGSTIGAYFGEVGPNDGLAELDSCVVTSRSYDAAPKGVFMANDGSLRVRRCVVDVAEINPNNPSRSAGVLASHQAEVTVNSSIVVVDRDTMWFVPISGGRFNVDYLTRWATDSDLGMLVANPRQVENPPGVDGGGNPELGVIYGPHIYTADPLLFRQGTWGAWTTPEQVAAYYGIAGTSPCVDAGDVFFGYDPDSTLPDIGRYYYSHSLSYDGPDLRMVPTTILLSPAYPNPFNATTTLPFDLDRRGHVTISVWDVTGRCVAVLTSGSLEAGSHTVQFGSGDLASGTYLVRINLNGNPVGAERLILLK